MMRAARRDLAAAQARIVALRQICTALAESANRHKAEKRQAERALDGMITALDEASAERNDLRARIAELETDLLGRVDQLVTERQGHHEALTVALEHNERLRNDLAVQQSLHRTREAWIGEMRRQRNNLEASRDGWRRTNDVATATIDAMTTVGDRLAADATAAVQREWAAAKDGRLLRVNGRFVKQS